MAATIKEKTADVGSCWNVDNRLVGRPKFLMLSLDAPTQVHCIFT